jgi:plasmid stabilization system protein ParE
LEPIGTVAELVARLDWTLNDDELRIAAGALEDASDLARGYGRDWGAASAPRLVRTLVLKACRRFMNNPNGYTQSRAGDETLGWNDTAGENAGTVYFTAEEQKLLARLAGKPAGLVSVPFTAWSPGPRRHGRPGYVPVDGNGTVFPLFPDEDGPW